MESHTAGNIYITVRRAILVALALLLWGLVAVLAIIAVVSAFAWFLGTSQFSRINIGVGYIDFPQIKARVEATGVNFEALLTISSAALSLVLLPRAKQFWRFATTIRPDYTKVVPSPDKRAYDREQLLRSVQNFWIDGVLKRSLYQNLIGLDVATQPNAVTIKTDAIVQMYDNRLYGLPPGKGIQDIFDQTRWLLVLGDPGAGKTTTLLELAQTLLERANNDAKEAIPVVLSLSAWTGNKKTSSIGPLRSCTRSTAYHAIQHTIGSEKRG